MQRPIALLLLLTTLTATATGEDWPDFRGANRQGKSAETGLLKQWPEGGPELIWSIDGLGAGYSSATIAAGTVYVTGMSGEPERLTSLFAYDLSGKRLWKTPIGQETKGAGYPGSRAAATVDRDQVYVCTSFGKLVCLDAATGTSRWTVELLKRFGANNIRWGISQSVLVHGDRLIVCPGGAQAMAALDRATGKTLWTTAGIDLDASYVAPVLMKRKGRELILTLFDGAIVGVDAKTGVKLWSHAFPSRHHVHAISPLIKGDTIFTAAAGVGAIALTVSEDGSSVKERWKIRTFDITFGGVAEVDGFLYATSTFQPKNKWQCVELATGTLRWTEAGVGKGAVILADGLLYCYGEPGGLALVRPDPTKLDVISRFEVTRGSGHHYAHPSISDGRMYLRHGDALMCYRIRAAAPKK